MCLSAFTSWKEGRLNHKVMRLLLSERNGFCLSRGPERSYWETVPINSGRLNSNSGPAAGPTSWSSTSFCPTSSLPPSTILDHIYFHSVAASSDRSSDGVEFVWKALEPSDFTALETLLF